MCRRLVDSIPMLLMVLGSSGLLGWVIHNPWLVRFNGEASSWPPMSQWAALGFFLLGWSHLGERTWKYSKWVAGFLFVLGLAFLFENMFNVSFACFDYAWANYWSDFWIENPGRLALGTSVCFLLSSLHMLSREKPVREIAPTVVGSKVSPTTEVT